MIEDRDSKGHFRQKQIVRKMISEGMVKLERVQVICPACGEQVEVVARDGRVKRYCAVAKQYVDFQVETQHVLTDKDNPAENMTKMSASVKKHWQDREYRSKQSAAKIGKHPTAETKAKISATLKRRHDAKSMTKMSASAKKFWQDPEYRAKQSVAHVGKHLTGETKAKISAAVTRWHNKKEVEDSNPRPL